MKRPKLRRERPNTSVKYTVKSGVRRLGPASKVLAALVFVLLLGGSYLLLLNLSPGLISFGPINNANALNLSDDGTDNQDRLQIAKINLEVGIYSGKTAKTLDKGVWHRFPERGDPSKGGNFILSAHRFELGLTPSGTKAKSPFYKVNQLAVGDEIRVFFAGKWYDYHITKIYSVKPDQTSIEAPSPTAKMTLYTCSIKGSADGRIVIEANL